MRYYCCRKGVSKVIDGVIVKHLKVLADERGWLMEILRCDDEFFDQFGQVYLTTCYPGVIKAWHCHREQTDRFCVVKGMAKVALWDGREKSPTKGELNVFYMGERNPILLVIPPGVWHGFTAVGNEVAFLLNCPNRPYNYASPDELRRPYNDSEIGYDWSVRHG
ncbi:MAG: dTDP-4-dehydrorhamnose 3,5-epimerase family protein [Armatimonadota bacterium]|nr:dTDP-4-dehydrorhamnose 3,5-epimerase family protein [Armatimonadota bacterium]